MNEVEPDQVQPIVAEPAVATKPKPPSRSHHKAPAAKPSKVATKSAGPALTPEQEIAASIGKLVNRTASDGVAAVQKVAENFLEGLLEYAHGDKKK